MSKDRPGITGMLRALHNLGHYKEEQPPIQTKSLDPQMAMLRAWQSKRLERTHADLLTSPRYGPASRFFIEEIYAARDFSQRDQDIEYLYEMMSRILPDILLGLVRNAAEINDLTNGLDEALLKVLVKELGVTDQITEGLYAQAYRICDNYDQRLYQIELLIKIGRQVDISTRLPLVGTALRLARVPARQAGWGDLYDFLNDGFKAFKHMHGAGEFLKTVQERETRILNRIFANDPNPFRI
jgi:hypothetical protein